MEFINFFQNSDQDLKFDEIKKNVPAPKKLNLFKNLSENSIFDLFPYCKKEYDSKETLLEIKESIKNLNTRLSNLKKINKSLDEFR